MNAYKTMITDLFKISGGKPKQYEKFLLLPGCFSNKLGSWWKWKASSTRSRHSENCFTKHCNEKLECLLFALLQCHDANPNKALL